MGLSYTGSSCLLMASVAGCRRGPEPPARMMPLRAVMVCASENFGEHARHTLLPVRKLKAESRLQFGRVQARVVRARGGRGEGAGGDRRHLGRFYFDRS